MNDKAILDVAPGSRGWATARLSGLVPPPTGESPGPKVDDATMPVIVPCPVLVMSIRNFASRPTSTASGPVIRTDRAFAKTRVVAQPSADRRSALSALKQLRMSAVTAARQLTSTTLVVRAGRSPIVH